MRVSLGDIALDVVDLLDAGDVLFVDGSHRVFTNSNATVISLGVLLHVHGIFLPNDYPPEWSDFFYSEQYRLACWPQAESRRIEVPLPNAFASDERMLRPNLALL